MGSPGCGPQQEDDGAERAPPPGNRRAADTLDGMETVVAAAWSSAREASRGDMLGDRLALEEKLRLARRTHENERNEKQRGDRGTKALHRQTPCAKALWQETAVGFYRNGFPRATRILLL